MNCQRRKTQSTNQCDYCFSKVLITATTKVLLKLLFLNLFIYLFLAALGLRSVFVAACGLSLAAASGGYSSLWCAGFSLQWLLLLQSTGSRHVGSVAVARGLYSAGSVAVVNGLSCSVACGTFPDQGSIPRPLHWQVDS